MEEPEEWVNPGKALLARLQNCGPGELAGQFHRGVIDVLIQLADECQELREEVARLKAGTDASE